MSPGRSLHGIVCILLFLISRTSYGSAEQESFDIKVNAALVTTDVLVIGNNPLPDLRANDFTIADNGVVQTITHFSRDLNPIAVALLIDRSNSVEPYLPALKIAALTALKRLRPEDQVALFTFDTEQTKLVDLTPDRLAIGREIGKIKAGYGTNLYDSIAEAASYLSKNARGYRRAIVLVSDNCHNETDAKHDAKSALVEMLESSATLYGIETGDTCKERADVGRISAETGGQILYAESATAIPAALEKAISSLRMQYTIGFSPSDAVQDGSFHKLTVKIAKDRCSACRILARNGYYAGVSAPFVPPPQLLARRDSKTATDQELIQRAILTAATTPLELIDIPFSVQTSEEPGSTGRRQLRIDLEIEPASIKFVAGKDGRACRVQIAVFYFNEKGEMLGNDWRKLEGSLNEQAYRRVQTEGILFSTTIPIETRKQIVKAVVYDEETDRVGSKLAVLPEGRN